MCGIITAVNTREDTAQAVLTAYSKQYSRGTDGFGFVSLTRAGKVHAYKRFTTFAGAEKALRKLARNTVVFHHRYPTSTPNTPDSNHPIKVSHDTFKYDYYVIHNGVISNADERKKVHEAIGLKYTTRIETGFRTASGFWYLDGDTEENDSEALAIDLALFLEGTTDRIEARGASAVVVLQVNKKGNTLHRLYYGRNTGNPLYYYRHKGAVLITSQNVTGKGADVPSGTLFALTADGRKAEKIPCDIPTYQWKSVYDTRYGFGSYTNTLLDAPSVKSSGPQQEKVAEKQAEKESERIDALESERDSIAEYISLAEDYARKDTLDEDTATDVETQRQRLADIDSELTKLYAK